MLGGTWGTCVQAAAAQLLQLPEQKRVLETQQENSFGVGLPPPTLLCVQRFRIQVWLVVLGGAKTDKQHLVSSIQRSQQGSSALRHHQQHRHLTSRNVKEEHICLKFIFVIFN